jgi:hypothetical protein
MMDPGRLTDNDGISEPMCEVVVLMKVWMVKKRRRASS